MTKDPAVLFYTSDFLSGTSFFTDEQRGQYIRLLCEQHQNGHIPEEHMLNICKSYDSPVMRKFIKDADGMFYNERMEKEALRRRNYSESRKENRQGKKNESLSYDNTYDQSYDTTHENHVSEHMETGNINDTITDTKDKEGGAGGRKRKFANIPPSIAEIEERMKERGIDNFTAEAFYSYYESIGWRVGKNKMISWDAALTTWQTNQRHNSKNGKPKTELQRIYEAAHEEKEIEELETKRLVAKEKFHNRL